jgi:hypothetical protein
MNTKKLLLGLAVALLAFAGTGCGEYGQVDQGRVIAFDKDKQTVTLVQDKAMDPEHPDYSIMPPHTYTMPTDPHERGADPNAGCRLTLDMEKKMVHIFNLNTQNLDDIPFEIVDKQEKVGPDHALVAGKKFPILDQEKKTITIYSSRQKLVVTIKVADEHFALPEESWIAGDEVRIYYKTAGVALRFMNITKTNIYKK